jgi:sortase B
MIRRFWIKLRSAIKFIFPHKGDGKSEILRKTLLLISLAAAAAGVWLIVSYFAEDYGSRQQNASLEKVHSSAVSAASASSSDNGGMLPEFTALYAKNKDIKGWITIPGTDIDYPVVETSDNDKYLHTGFNNQPSKSGTLFLDFRDTIEPFSQDLIIYGHNLKDGQMFNQLDKYERRANNDYLGFYNSSPVITFNTLYSRDKWKIFAVFVTTADSSYTGSLYYLNTGFGSDEDFNSFITGVRKRSFINTGVDVSPSDKLLTLSTCDYNYPMTDDGEYARLVVMARRVRNGESLVVGKATINDSVLFPECYFKK